MTHFNDVKGDIYVTYKNPICGLAVYLRAMFEAPLLQGLNRALEGDEEYGTLTP